MRRVELLQAVDQEVGRLWPELPRPEQQALAGLMCGIVCAEQAQVSRASASCGADSWKTARAPLPDQ